MALLLPNNQERKKMKEGNKLTTRDITIKHDLDSRIGARGYSAKERKPVQVDPPVLKTIRNVAYAKDLPMYKVVEEAMNAYLKSLTKDEKMIYDNRPSRLR